MATVIDIQDLALSPQEVQSISELVFEKKIEKGNLNTMHAVQTGIQSGKKIGFVGALGLVGECIDGCNIPAGSTIPMSEKLWAPKTVGFRLTHCSKDLNGLAAFLKKKINRYPDEYDMTGSPEETVILMKTEDATEDMLWRHLHFGDTTIANVADDGYLKDGVAVKYFNCIDGLWKQVFSITALTTGGKHFVPISANSGSNYAAQDTLATDFTKVLLRDMIKKADSRLKSAANKVFLATESLIENLLDSYEEVAWKNAVDIKKDLQAITATYGKTNYVGTYRGVDIYSIVNWDETIRTYFDNGTKWDKPHRAILTTPDNIPIGTPSTEMLGSMDSFYDRKDKKNYVDAEMMIDVKLLEDYMAVAAY